MAEIRFTEKAEAKVREIVGGQDPKPEYLRLGVRGGGCSGFEYTMVFENEKQELDKVFELNGFKVIVDAMSLQYLDGAEVDYIETLEASGFKFSNPNAKSTCGCGSSFGA